MDSKIMVSVAIITYNHGAYVKHALDSVIMQDLDYNYEIVIGDDCSSDNTREIVYEYKNKYPKLIKVLERKENMGPTKNLYDVYMNCSGKYIAFLEGDDFFTDKNKLKKQVDFLETNTQYKSCAHRLEIVNKNEEHILFTHSDLELNRPMGQREFNLYNTDMLHLNTMVFFNFFKENNDDYSIVYKSNNWSCHSIILLLCLKYSDIYVMDKAMSVWRMVNETGAENYTSQASNNKLLFLEEKLKLYDAERRYFARDLKKINFSQMIAKAYISGKQIEKQSYENLPIEWKRKTKKYTTLKDRTYGVFCIKMQTNISRIKCIIRKIVK